MRNLKKLLFAILTSLIAVQAFSEVSYNMSYVSTGGNPSGINTEADNLATGWTLIYNHASTNSWSTVQSMPFDFDFFGTAVTQYKVSANGLITFNTSSSTLPSDASDNKSMPSTLIPDQTIACFWDLFSRESSLASSNTNDAVYIKVLGSSPKRQLWIKWFSNETNKKANFFYSCVLEEGSNSIYMVDQRTASTTSTTSATIGLQNSSTEYRYNTNSAKLASTAYVATDNKYYQFVPFSYSVYSNETYTSEGNPASLNTESDNATTGWTTILEARSTTSSSNRWSSVQSLPSGFNFKFMGKTCSSFMVSCNGLLTFATTTSITTPPSSNISLPSSTVPDYSIAAFFDNYTTDMTTSGTNDYVMTKTFGTAPNRQFWVKWNSFSANAVSNYFYALVLNESDNAVYMVELRQPASGALTSTVGVQLNSDVAYSISGSPTLAMSVGNNYASSGNNNYYEFIPFPSEDYEEPNTVELSYSEINSSANEAIVISHSSCLDDELESSYLNVKLDLGEDFNYAGYEFSVLLNYSIKAYLAGTASYIESSTQLAIETDAPEQLYHVNLKDVVTNYENLESIELADFSLLVTAPSGVSTFTDDIRLSAWVDESYKVDVNSGYFKEYSLVEITNAETTNNRFSLEWSSYCERVPAYQLQICRLLNTEESYSSDAEKLKCEMDWNKALTLYIEDTTSYSLYLMEGNGYYAYRIRAIGNYYNNTVGNDKNWGEWTNAPLQDEEVDISSTSAIPDGMIFISNDITDKNWVYSRTFTEDNNMHEGIIYANGLNMKKQEQMLVQGKDSTLITQTIYDYCGRPALATMSVPVANTKFEYNEEFVKEHTSGDLFNASHFDADDNYDSAAKVKDNTGEAWYYFSDNNPDLSVPDAEGLPYSRTLFRPDGRNTPIEIANPGSTFSLGGGHTIKTYISDISEDELVPVFGDEALGEGKAFKSIVVDQNNVVNVTYYSKDGVKLATCISGKDVNNLDNIDDYESQDITNEITSSYVVEENKAYKKETKITLEPGTEVNVSYEITPASFQIDCENYCYTCDYDITVYIKDEDGNTLDSKSKVISPEVCETSLVPVSISLASYMVDDYDIVVGRTIKVNNKNEDDKEYIQVHKDNVEEKVYTQLSDALIYSDEEALITFASYLEDGDIDNAYQFLIDNASFGIAEEDIYGDAAKDTITLSTSCCSIKLPVLACQDACTQIFDTDETTGKVTAYAEEYFEGYWNNEYGTAPSEYFIDLDGKSKYPANVESSTTLTVSSSTTGSVDVNIWVQYDNSVSQPIFCNTNDEWTEDEDWSSFSSYSIKTILSGSAADEDIATKLVTAIESFLAAKYGSTTSAYPFIVSVSGAVITVKPNVDYGTRTDGTIYWELSGFKINGVDKAAEINGATFTTTEEDDAKGDGYFNKSLEDYINNEGGDCETIAQLWMGYTQSYPNLQYANGNIYDTKNPFDMFESFWANFRDGVKYFSDHPYGNVDPLGNHYYENSSTSSLVANEDLKTYGPGYLEYPYMALEYDTSSNYFATSSVTGELIFVPSDAENGVYETCEDYFGLIQDDAGASMSTWTAEDFVDFIACVNSDFSVLETTLNMSSCTGGDLTSAETMIDNAIAEGEYMCERRWTSFYNEFIRQGLSEKEALCRADLCVENCKNDCEVTYTTVDTDGDGTNDAIDEINGEDNLTMALTYNFEVTETDATGLCSSEYTKLGDQTRLSEQIVNELNMLIENGEIIDQSYSISDLKTLFTNVYSDLGYTFKGSCDFAIPSGYCITFTDETVFDVDISSSSKSTITYTNSYLPVCGLTTTTLSDGDLIELGFSSTGTSSCDFNISCGPFCFKWVEPSEIETDVVLVYESCEEINAEILLTQLDNEINNCMNAQKDSVETQYTNGCMIESSIDDKLTATYNLGYHHYTLYYYDRVGNLIRTVPPKGINLVGSRIATSHTLDTKYSYNTLNQLTEKTTPDGGTTKYYYNDMAQLRITQDAQQAEDGFITYHNYDKLGRLIETGIYNAEPSDITESLNTWKPTGAERIVMVYSTEGNDADGNPITYLTNSEKQSNLLNRISYTYYDIDGSETTTNDRVSTFYSYDVHGNVSWMVQEQPELGKTYTSYKYDLISRKVTEVNSNEGRVDQFFQRISYDADLRVTSIESSTDKVIWDKDASYKYYAHGPLSRKELGEDHIQGVDYTYTLQGWLKGINAPSLSSTDDKGGDGTNKFANDAFGMTLNYFQGDFNRTGSIYNVASASQNYNTSSYALYNGNITSWTENSQEIKDVDLQYNGIPKNYQYKYDQLYRLKESKFEYFEK